METTAVSNNLIAQAIVQRRVDLPGHPLNLSELFRDRGITNVYVIAMTGRCGSTWLASELASLQNSGSPKEFFSEQRIAHHREGECLKDALDLFDSIIEEGRTEDTFGFKIDPLRLNDLAEIVDLKASFDGRFTRWIDMRRVNIVKQAFSYARAKYSGVWHKYNDQRSADDSQQHHALDIPDDIIWREIRRIVGSEERLDEIYCHMDLKPLPIVYEELVDSKRHILLRVLAYLFPERKVSMNIMENLNNPKGKTEKLSGDAADEKELEFVLRNATGLNELFIARSLRV